jgi:protein tyrosine phosphatase (PTP) superfamily phosphohydrolase (DUF442 family)
MSASPAEAGRPPVRPGSRLWLNSLFIDHAALRLGWRNWGAVEEGRLYRSNHPLPWQLRQAARRSGLRTVINLRGERETCGSDRLGRAEAAALGLAHVDAPFESRGAPHRDRVLRLAEIYRAMAEPALIHCKSGADRTGLAAGIWLLLQGRPPERRWRSCRSASATSARAAPASSTPSSCSTPRPRGAARSRSSNGCATTTTRRRCGNPSARGPGPTWSWTAFCGGNDVFRGTRRANLAFSQPGL